VPKRLPKPPTWLLAAGLAGAALYLLAALRLPIGALNDDAANVLLARSLLHGAFQFPGGLGKPEEFLPGMPALLALPAALVAPNWGLLRAIPLFCVGLTLWLTWRVARRFLGAEAAFAAVLLTAFNPTLVGLGGLVMPYLPYLALSLALVEAADAKGPRAAGLFLLGAAFAPLLRPHGALLAACLALPLAHEKKWSKAAALLGAAVLPLAAWTLRNRLTPGASDDYSGIWRAQLVDIGTPLLELRHAGDLLARLLGESLLGLPDAPYAARVFAGAAALAAAGWGAARLAKRRPDDARVFALAAYPAAILLLHMTWRWVSTRYAIALVPFVWILIAAAAEPLFARRRALAFGGVAALALLSLRWDAQYAWRGLTAPAAFAPNTMAQIRDKTPEDARLYAVKNYSVALLTGRACAPLPIAHHYFLWVFHAGQERISRTLIQQQLPGDEFTPSDLPPTYQTALADKLLADDAVPEFRDPDEGTLLLRMPYAKR